MTTISDQVSKKIRNVPDFPKPGIQFKDISPLFQDPQLVSDMVKAMAEQWKNKGLSGVAGVESRGFLLGPLLAQELGLPFHLIRKKGKLPAETWEASYDLEYGSASIEMHKGAVGKGDQILIHDDLLATGGTVKAAVQLLAQAEAQCAGFSFIVELDFLAGGEELRKQGYQVESLVHY